MQIGIAPTNRNTMATDGTAALQRWRDPPVYRMLSPGTLLSGEHLNKVWRGMTQVPMSTEPGIPMIVKWVEKKERLAAELACSLAARAFRIQVPAGVLVLAQKDQLQGLPRRVTGRDQDMVLCFGSEFQWPDDTLARPADTESAREWVWNRLCQSNQGAMGGVWDELVANEDRHTDNVVFDGVRWWLIDHEKTITPLNKLMMKFAESTIRQTVVEHRAPSNPIVAEMVNRRPADHKMEALPQSMLGLRASLQWLADQAQSWHTGIAEVDTVLMMTHIYLRSIDIRLPALALHLHERLAKPAPVALWSHSSQ